MTNAHIAIKVYTNYPIEPYYYPRREDLKIHRDILLVHSRLPLVNWPLDIWYPVTIVNWPWDSWYPETVYFRVKN